ncbi:unnamed protein product [Ceratitis capitata]|uniref:(Mediterranean fruit fly) hypothetical protein n=1 Tax=Ceratitis capitata TaxID=7213 RepID=A0A811UMC8_CERCA|nr:unnamed protein product [Ceratitis capitata]
MGTLGFERLLQDFRKPDVVFVLQITIHHPSNAMAPQGGNQKVGREKEIHIFWVPDHIGIKGYEMTDELTKDEAPSA